METVPTTATNDTAPAPPDDSLKATNPWISVFGVYLIILNVVLIYLIFRVWPGRVPLDEGPARVTIIPGYYELNLWPEPRYMCIVSLVGAHAAYIHLATSFTEFLGNRNFYSSWKWWYGFATIHWFRARFVGLFCGPWRSDLRKRRGQGSQPLRDRGLGGPGGNVFEAGHG